MSKLLDNSRHIDKSTGEIQKDFLTPAPTQLEIVTSEAQRREVYHTYLDEQKVFNEFGSVSGAQEAITREAIRLGVHCTVEHMPGNRLFKVRFIRE